MPTKVDAGSMHAEYTAVIKQDAAWWIGWIEEVPGVNCQESSRDKLLSSLELALREALQMDCRSAAIHVLTQQRQE
jgi:hypothetical protein